MDGSLYGVTVINTKFNVKYEHEVIFGGYIQTFLHDKEFKSPAEWKMSK